MHVEEPTPNTLVIHDRGVDILIPPTSLRYDVLDLDDFADALESGTLDLPAATRVLRDTQRFIDRHLRIPGQAPPTAWPDFPPASIQPLIELPPFAAA
ncbi:hypothetical protein ACQPXM_31115 [Kribbella sp. CA-253562]|uniref:hypothetical protein n=1 Tax=Kribbella sp. CA-253562 TaxID=3239942 RepID=UPI003D92670A